MKIVYKGCTYRTENLTDKQKELMSVEIGKAKSKAERLKEQAGKFVKETAKKTDKKAK